MPDNETLPQIREFVYKTFPHARKNQVKDADSLLESGIVDSMGVVDIVSFLESELNIVLNDDEMVAENFESIEKIASFADSCLKQIAD